MSIAKAIAVVQGKTIDWHGVVIVPDSEKLEPLVVGRSRVALEVKSFLLLGYHDTTGNIIQLKEDIIPPGKWFDAHSHPDMDEVFLYCDGGAITFTVQVHGEEPYEVTLGPGGMIMFPAGVSHAARNDSDVASFFISFSVRSGNAAAHDINDGKGKYIPRHAV